MKEIASGGMIEGFAMALRSIGVPLLVIGLLLIVLMVLVASVRPLLRPCPASW